MRKLITAAVLAAALVCVPIALAASSPIVSAGATTSISETSATLHGTVNPNGLATTYQFHYGPTSALGAVSPSTAASAGAGTAGVAVATKLAGLSPDTTYYVQLVASNSAGSSSTSIGSFKTTGNPAPTTTTSPAVDVSRYGATLVGVVNPNNQTTAYHFDFGLTTSYGLETSSKTVPAGTAPVAVGIQLPGLQPGQVYHYRLVADHSSTSITYGADMTFQTPPWPRPHTKLKISARTATDPSAPFVYTMLGTVAHSATVPTGYGCHGTVTIRVLDGSRTLSRHTVPVGSTTCTYRSVFRFAHIPGSGATKLTVKARYFGDEWDAPAVTSANIWAR
jgi:hypothetical protein